MDSDLERLKNDILEENNEYILLEKNKLLSFKLWIRVLVMIIFHFIFFISFLIYMIFFPRCSESRVHILFITICAYNLLLVLFHIYNLCFIKEKTLRIFLYWKIYCFFNFLFGIIFLCLEFAFYKENKLECKKLNYLQYFYIIVKVMITGFLFINICSLLCFNKKKREDDYISMTSSNFNIS